MSAPSIRQTAPVLLVLPVFVAVLALVLISGWQGRRSAEDLAGQVLDQAASRVQCTVREYLQNAVQTTDQVAWQIADGELDAENLEAWQRPMFRQLSVNSKVNSVTFGNTAGDSTWMIRYPGEPGLEYAISNDKSDQQTVEYQVTEDGQDRKSVV